LLHDEPLENITTTVTKTQGAIDTALGLLRQRLRPLLAIQEQAGTLHTRISTLTTEVGGQRALSQGGTVADASPAMSSAPYFPQLAVALSTGVHTGLVQISWPDKSFFAWQGWIMVLQGVFALLLALAALGVSCLASWMLQTLLTENVLARRNVDTGVSLSVSRLLHYALIPSGFVLALVVLGVDLTKMTLLASALGVGIGFGLQTIVNNFVCGPILLLERPLRMGDTIELGGQPAKIAKIGLRSTTVRTPDQADMIVPNINLITNRVTNWTLTDRQARSVIPVGVAYGSDIALVMQALQKCALAHPGVLQSPEPQVLFRSFGDSALDFELRAWVADVDTRLQVASDLHQDIDRRFRQAGIVIPFPQRDLHVRGVENMDHMAAIVKAPLD
jgi:small-conductance mechanosensitive channel